MERDPERRRKGLETMAAVYGWPEVGDGDGDFFGITVEHLFAEVWTREGLSFRDAYGPPTTQESGVGPLSAARAALAMRSSTWLLSLAPSGQPA